MQAATRYFILAVGTTTHQTRWKLRRRRVCHPRCPRSGKGPAGILRLPRLLRREKAVSTAVVPHQCFSAEPFLSSSDIALHHASFPQRPPSSALLRRFGLPSLVRASPHRHLSSIRLLSLTHTSSPQRRPPSVQPLSLMCASLPRVVPRRFDRCASSVLLRRVVPINPAAIQYSGFSTE